MSLISGTLITNTSWLSTTTARESGEAQTRVEVEPPPEPTLDITKTAPLTVTAGDLVTYTISWQISGTVPVDNVAITDSVPVSTTFWDASQPTASEPAQGETGVVAWVVGRVTPTLGSPEQGVVTLTVLSSDVLITGTLITNTSWLSTTTARESGEAQTRVEVEPPPEPTLDITKTAPLTVTAGDLVTYTISWLISGTVPVDNVAITDSVPVSTTFWDASQPTASEPAQGETGVVAWVVGRVTPTLGSPEQGVVTLTVLSSDVLITGTLITNTSWLSTTTARESGEAQTRVEVEPPPEPTLDITKTAPLTVTAGDLVTYTISWLISGTVPVDNVAITDSVPVSTTFWDASQPTASEPAQGETGVVEWAVGRVTPTLGSPEQGVVTLTVLSSDVLISGTLITNTSWLSTTTARESGEAQTRVEVEPPPEPTLDITKTAPLTVTAGDLVTYTISWQISGTVPVDNVGITDSVPVSTTFWNASQPTASEPAQGETGVVEWAVGRVTPTLGSPEQGVVTLTVLSSDVLITGTLITNTSWLSTTTARESGEAQTRVEVEPPPEPTLDITKTAPLTVTAGDLVTYTISWQISGTVPMDNVAITDSVPVSTTFWDASQPTASEPAQGETGVVEWAVGRVTPTLGSPEQGVVTLTVLSSDALISGTLITNRAWLSTTASQSSDEVVTRVEEEPLPESSFDITKTAPVTVARGNLVTYTISWLITGTVPVDHVAITDSVPVNTTFWEASQPTESEPVQGGTGVVTWSLGRITPTLGSPAQGVVMLTVLSSDALISGTLVTNTSWLSATTARLSDEAVTRIVRTGPWLVYLPVVTKNYRPPDLRASTKTANPDSVNAGEVLTYSITVRNTGTAAAADVFLHDPMPTGTSYRLGSAEGCSYSSQEDRIEWNGSVPGGDFHTCQFEVITDHDASGKITNTATITSSPLASGLVIVPVAVQDSSRIMVTNGGFETEDTSGWVVSGDDPLPAPSVVEANGGISNPLPDSSYHLLLGTSAWCNSPNPEEAADHSSVASQTIYVPNEPGTTPRLEFWYRILTYDHLLWTTDLRLGDSLDVYVGGALALRDNFENWPDPLPGCSDLQDSGWRTPDSPWGGDVYIESLILDEWVGQTVEIRFELWTRWDGWYNTWAYIDGVRVALDPEP